jgi:DNA-binding XRE family transcriptional regulator
MSEDLLPGLSRETVTAAIGTHLWVQQLYASGEARRVRVACGLSIPPLADIAGVHPATMGRWETGERRPSRANALRIAPALREMVKVAPERGAIG